MIEGFFLHRVHMLGHQTPINKTEKNPISVLAHPADTPMSILDPALMGAELTDHLTITALAVQLCLMHQKPLPHYLLSLSTCCHFPSR